MIDFHALALDAIQGLYPPSDPLAISHVRFACELYQVILNQEQPRQPKSLRGHRRLKSSHEYNEHLESIRCPSCNKKAAFDFEVCLTCPEHTQGFRSGVHCTACNKTTFYK